MNSRRGPEPHFIRVRRLKRKGRKQLFGYASGVLDQNVFDLGRPNPLVVYVNPGAIKASIDTLPSSAIGQLQDHGGHWRDFGQNRSNLIWAGHDLIVGDFTVRAVRKMRKSPAVGP
jgi:hypothetical protein